MMQDFMLEYGVTLMRTDTEVRQPNPRDVTQHVPYSSL